MRKKEIPFALPSVWNLFSASSGTVFYLQLFHHARQYIGNYGECCHAVNVQIVSARLGFMSR